MFALMLIYNIANSGCLLYPVQITCPDNIIWGYGKEKIISKARGKWFKIKIGRCEPEIIVTFHPAFLIRQPEQKKNSWYDLKLIREKI